MLPQDQVEAPGAREPEPGDAVDPAGLWLHEVLRVPSGSPLRDLSRVVSVGLDLPDGWQRLCAQLADPGALTLHLAAVPDGTGFGVRASGTRSGSPGERLSTLAATAQNGDRRLDSADLVLALGVLTDTGGAPTWSAAAGGAQLGRAPLLLLPVRLAREARDVWSVHVEPGASAWTNLAAARAVAEQHPGVAALLLRTPRVPVTHLADVLARVGDALEPDGRPNAPRLQLLVTADLVCLPLGPLLAAANLRAADVLPVRTGPSTPPPRPASGPVEPRPDGLVVELLSAPAGPGGTGIVTDAVLQALAAGRRVAVVAPVDDDLRPLAGRLAAADLGPFVLDLTGPCATRDPLSAHLAASGQPTAAPVVAAAQVARERSELLARLAADTALAHAVGPGGLSLWQVRVDRLRLEAELPPEAVVAARTVDLPLALATSAALRDRLLDAAGDVQASMTSPAGRDPWPADDLPRWTPDAAERVAGAVRRLVAAGRDVAGPVRALLRGAATPAELTVLARWLQAVSTGEPVIVDDAVLRCDAGWQADANRVRAGLSEVHALWRERLADLRPSALGLDPAPLLAELAAEPERGWLDRATGRSGAQRRDSKAARRLDAHRRAGAPPRSGTVVDQLTALDRVRREAADLTDLAVRLLPDPGPWNPLAEVDEERITGLLELWAATAALAHLPWLDDGSVQAAAAAVHREPAPATGRGRRWPARDGRDGRDGTGRDDRDGPGRGGRRGALPPPVSQLDLVAELVDATGALTRALGLAEVDEGWLGGRSVLATLEQVGDAWTAELADGLPTLRRRVLLRTGVATLRAVGAADLVTILDPQAGAGPRTLPLVRPEHLRGVAELATLRMMTDERVAALSSAPARLSTAERADVISRAAELEGAHRQAARGVVPHRLFGHVPGGPDERAELAASLVAELADRPLRDVLAERGEDVGALLPALLVPAELVARAMPLIADGGLLVVDHAGQVPAASIAAAAGRTAHVLLVDRSDASPEARSALAELGQGAPAVDARHRRRPELRVRPSGASWERHVADVQAAARTAGFTVLDGVGPGGTAADLVVRAQGLPPVAVMLDPPDTAARPGTHRAAEHPDDGESPPEVALTAWLGRVAAELRDVPGTWSTVVSVSLTAWVVDPSEVMAQVSRAALGARDAS